MEENSKFKLIHEERARAKKEENSIRRAEKATERENKKVFLHELLENNGILPEEQEQFRFEEELNYVEDDMEHYVNTLAAVFGVDEMDYAKLREEYYAELQEIGLDETNYVIDSKEKVSCFNKALKVVNKQSLRR